jgi:hypothetical protein
MCLTSWVSSVVFIFQNTKKFRARTRFRNPLRGIPEYSGIIPEYSGIIPEFRNNETARAPWGVSGVVKWRYIPNYLVEFFTFMTNE